MRAEIAKGQTLFDMAVQHCGEASAAFDIAALNNLSLTDTPQAGTMLLLPNPSKPKVVDALAAHGVLPACAVEASTWERIEPMGVGFWRIGYTFVIS